jgi:hypothetical protein
VTAPSRALAPVLALGVLAAVLSGCATEAAGAAGPEGSAPQLAASPGPARTGPRVAADAAFALQQAGVVTVRGTLTIDGRPVHVDAHLQGEDAAATVSFGTGRLQLVRVGGATYGQGSAGFWTTAGASADVGAGLAGRWVLLPPDDGFGGLSLSAFGAILDDTGSAVLDPVDSTTFEGVPVTVVHQQDGSELWVAATGPAYPLRLEQQGDQPASVTFSDFGVRQDITAPADPFDPTRPGR